MEFKVYVLFKSPIIQKNQQIPRICTYIKWNFWNIIAQWNTWNLDPLMEDIKCYHKAGTLKVHTNLSAFHSYHGRIDAIFLKVTAHCN